MSRRHKISVVVLGVLALLFLQSNAATARRKAEEIKQLDAAGKPTLQKEKELRKYSLDHMNASTEFELTGSYRRAQQEQQRASQNRVNGQVYAQAQAACGGRRDSVSQAKCVREYASRQAPAPVVPVTINRKAYVRESNSPGWTPDLAGISLLAAVIAAILALVKPKRHGRR